MKNLIALIIMMAFILPTDAQSFISFNGKELKDIKNSEPQISISEINNGKRVKIVFPGAKIKPDQHFKGCKRLYIPGCAEESQSGMPAVLYFKETFDLNQGSQPKIKNIATEYNDIRFTLAPAETSQLESEKKSMERKAIQNPTTIYPSNEYSFTYDGRYYDRDLYTFKINVIRYLNDSTISALKTIRFDIVESDELNTEILSYQKMSKLSEGPKTSKEGRSHIRNISIDITPADTTIEPNFMSLDNSDYIIITNDSLINGIEDFVEWKRSIGHNVKVFSSSNWTPEDIKSTISNFCADFDYLSYQYLLIIGDINKVPSNMHIMKLPKYTANYPTDMPYACINGEDDNIPELFYARIPTASCEQTKSVLKKIIEYEKNPTLDDSFYNTVTHVAYFQDNDDDEEKTKRDGYEDRFFIEGSEEMRNFAISKGKIANRIYNADPAVNPLYWGKYGKGGDIPSELRRPNFQWNGFRGDVINKINEGSMYVMYRGHGGTNGWDNILFGTPFIQYLTNEKKLPFLFSVTCWSGAFDYEDCLASNFMLSENNGGIGAIGATDISYSGENDALSSAMIFALLAKSQNETSWFTYKPSTLKFIGKPDNHHAMGNVLAYAKRSMAKNFSDDIEIRYQNEIFHLYGDPGMDLYTQKPDSIKPSDVLVGWSANDMTVSAPQGAYISFYNTKTKTVQRYYDTIHTFKWKNLDPTDFIVCVRKYNHIPYIMHPAPAIPSDPYPGGPIVINEFKSISLDQSRQMADIEYIVNPEAKNAFIQVTSIVGEIKKLNDIDKTLSNTTIDLYGLPKGSYIVNLIVDGVNCGNKNIRI